MGRVYVDALLVRAAEEARRAGSRTMEAEHVLLALAAEPDGDVAEVLGAAGLDYQGVQDALRREFEHGLGTAGISIDDEDVLRPRAARRQPSDIGESGRFVLEQAMGTVRKRDMRAPHLLLGILELKVGTVPRALDLAGVDVEGLKARTRALL
ncbi:Clp protease N-terminal domain-containing protein [Actinomadura gamaensis]|uniref:Clp protease N-terminal domain-containing protein n=1 Tax=Actinomadura gamaensis TaxID=1763541 RepID=A0ABV9U819_9ACTN